MTRRTLLSLTGAGAVAYSQQKSLGIGFIGMSHSHAAGKLAVLRSSPDWRVVGIAENDPKLQKIVREQGIPLLSRDELLKHPEIKAIAVESAVRDHAPDGLAVLQAGKHLHLEKAPADSMSFRNIVSLARDKSLLLQVGYMWPTIPPSQRPSKRREKDGLGRFTWSRPQSAINSRSGAGPNGRSSPAETCSNWAGTSSIQ